MDRAICARDRGLKLVFAGGGPRRSERRHELADVRRRQGFEKDFLAARTQRGEHTARPVRDDQKQRARRRLLDEFQKRIGTVRVEVLGAIENADPVAAPPRRLLEHVDGTADILDPDFGKEPFVLFIALAAQENEIGMRYRDDST